MLSRSSSVALFFVVAACISLGYSKTNSQGDGSARHDDISLVRWRSSFSANSGTDRGSSASESHLRSTSSHVYADTGPLSSTATVYSQPPSGALLQQQSSQVGYNPYASDYDQYVWDDFTLNYTRAITEIVWRGVYNSGGNFGGSVIDFTVAVYTSTASNTQPDHLNPPLVQYTVGGNAGEIPPWTPSGVSASIHDYTFTLPAPFTATAGVKYWVQIEGIQNGPADWGIVAGTGGDKSHFYAVPGVGDYYFNKAPGDAAFTLLGPPTDIYVIYLPLILQ